jgi:hypothetical protein
MDEQVRHLVYEFQGFAVLEHHFFLLLLLLLLAVLLLVHLPPVDAELGLFHMLAEFEQELGLILEKLEEFEVVGFVV